MGAELAGQMVRRGKVTRVTRFRGKGKENAAGQNMIDIVF